MRNTFGCLPVQHPNTILNPGSSTPVIQKIRAITLIKSDCKDIYIVTKTLFQRNAVLLNHLFIKES